MYTLFSGGIGKKFIVKHYDKKIILTKYPVTTRITASAKQRKCRNLFKEAITFARLINNDPVKKKHWQHNLKKGTVYNNAIRQYIKINQKKK